MGGGRVIGERRREGVPHLRVSVPADAPACHF